VRGEYNNKIGKEEEDCEFRNADFLFFFLKKKKEREREREREKRKK
jgi:hypothetical protein